MKFTADAEQATCSECNRPRLARGLCNAHYKAHRKTGALETIIRPRALTLPEAFAWHQSTECPEEGCWDWTGTNTDEDGYGLFAYGSGSAVRAPRASYLIHKGEIPNGQMVRHTCDRRICVQPAHLILGTNDDNMQDMADRQRARRGRAHPNAKLNEQAVLRMRHFYAEGWAKRALAREFEVSAATVAQIVSRTTWRHL